MTDAAETNATRASSTTPRPRFTPGARVQVDTRLRPGHIRTPVYLLGKRGTIMQCQGAYHSAEKLAYMAPGPYVPLYLVEFDATEVWGERVQQAERQHRLCIEIYEDWLSAI
jgi:nitrile hydratase